MHFVLPITIFWCLTLTTRLSDAQFGGDRSNCPQDYVVETYPDSSYCDRFSKCENGTYTDEVCENGLVFSGVPGTSNIHNHCSYNWEVDCGERIYDDTPLSSEYCLYQYGIYPISDGGCHTTFYKCAGGVAYETPCPRGQAYNRQIHRCDYPDQVEYCTPEEVVGFSCNVDLPPNAVTRRFLPFPRFEIPDDNQAYIVCVNKQPRVQFCGDNTYFDPQYLTCVEF